MNISTTFSTRQLVLLTISSGLLWFGGLQISIQLGWLLWFAPIPLLVLSYSSTKRTTFLCSAVAFLIGRLSWLPFLMKVLPLPVAVILTFLLPLIFGLVMLLVRWIMRRSIMGMVFAYPLIMTLLDYIFYVTSADGTAGSLAYQQMNYLPLIQIASITGLWGITWILSFIPSLLAALYLLKDSKTDQRRIAVIGASIILVTVIFGWYRLATFSSSSSVKVGLVSIPENQLLYPKKNPDFAAERKVVEAYADAIRQLGNQKYNVVLFPEKAIHVQQSERDSLLLPLVALARERKISIVGGVLVFKAETKQNITYWIDSTGTVRTYMKRHHVRGFEDGEEVGETIGWIPNTPQFATAICKDMDFPQWLTKYSGASVLFVPAWDFEEDGWLHCRMAILRGIENGYSIVRSARQGRLTVSDPTGRVLAEENCDKGNAGSLIANVPLGSVKTIYAVWGDWFVGLCALAFLILIAMPRRVR